MFRCKSSSNRSVPIQQTTGMLRRASRNSFLTSKTLQMRIITPTLRVFLMQSYKTEISLGSLSNLWLDEGLRCPKKFFSTQFISKKLTSSTPDKRTDSDSYFKFSCLLYIYQQLEQSSPENYCPSLLACNLSGSGRYLRGV